MWAQEVGGIIVFPRAFEGVHCIGTAWVVLVNRRTWWLLYTLVYSHAGSHSWDYELVWQILGP